MLGHIGGMDDLLEIINAALRARGWSAQHASTEAVASPDYVRDLRRGRLVQVEKFRRLCEALGLEFYVGPRRRFASLDERRLEVAVDTTVRAARELGVELRAGRARSGHRGGLRARRRGGGAPRTRIGCAGSSARLRSGDTTRRTRRLPPRRRRLRRCASGAPARVARR